MNASDIRVLSTFTNKSSTAAGKSKKFTKAFIKAYILRDDAVEPLVTSDEQQRKYVASLSQLRSPEDQDAIKILNHKLHYDGIGFDLENASLSRQQQNELANDCQKAYDRGGTVRKMVISFRTDYLKEHGVLDPSVKTPVLRSDLHDKLDQQRLREAIQDGMKAMINQTTMHNPQIIGAIQVDTQQVHAHLCLWDRDPKVKDDRGFVNQRLKDSVANGIETHLLQNGPHLNTTRMLKTIAQTTQQSASFKRKMLERELYQSALRLDRQSLDEYVMNLAMFDQRTLSERQRDHLKEKIQQDWREVGRPDTRSHTLSQGQRRSRRQIRAMKRATLIRKELKHYNQVDAVNEAVMESKPVKDAMAYEYQHQMKIVEKYRGYQRPRVEAIYRVRQEQLTNRRQVLLEHRKALLKKLEAPKLREHYVQRLLGRPDVMQGLAKQYDGPVTQSPVYKELRKAQDDPHYPLDEHVVRAVKRTVTEPEGERIAANLTRNQQPKSDGLSPQQRIWLADYLQELEEYEMDAASWGGLGTNEMKFQSADDKVLPIPPETSSIYDRKLMRDDPDLIAVDAHEILDAGSLNFDVDLAMRKQLSERADKLLAAHDYFKKTRQRDPAWLQYAQKDLDKQFKLLINPADLPVPARETSAVKRDGYVLTEPQQKTLVEKHLKSLNAMER